MILSSSSWKENGNRTSWSFHDAVGHNNAESGLFVWQNVKTIENHIDDFVAYRNGFQGINHGAYSNRYQYRGALLTGTGFLQFAKSAEEGSLVIEDILSDAPLVVGHHNSAVMDPTFFRRCTFPSVRYEGETSNGSYNRYEDCGLTPTDFVLTGIASTSIIEVWEAGVLQYRWQSGVWS